VTVDGNHGTTTRLNSSCVKACAQIRATTMSSDTQSPHPPSPVNDSAHSVRVHSSPTPVISGATASGTLPDASKTRTRSVAAILRDTSTLLDRNACIISPFDDEVRRDAEFHQSQFGPYMHTYICVGLRLCST
jgi:hypothetical protein